MTTTADPPEPCVAACGFRTTVVSDDHEVVLAAIGEVVRPFAGQLGALLAALLFQNGRRVVLDLVDLTSMDASGLTAIATAIRESSPRDERLAVRSAPNTTRRMLDVTELSRHLEFEETAA